MQVTISIPILQVISRQDTPGRTPLQAEMSFSHDRHWSKGGQFVCSHKRNPFRTQDPFVCIIPLYQYIHLTTNTHEHSQLHTDAHRCKHAKNCKDDQRCFRIQCIQICIYMQLICKLYVVLILLWNRPLGQIRLVFVTWSWRLSSSYGSKVFNPWHPGLVMVTVDAQWLPRSHVLQLHHLRFIAGSGGRGCHRQMCRRALSQRRPSRQWGGRWGFDAHIELGIWCSISSLDEFWPGYGVFLKGGVPKQWLAYSSKKIINGWFGGPPYFEKPPYVEDNVEEKDTQTLWVMQVAWQLRASLDVPHIHKGPKNFQEPWWLI